MSVGSRAGGEPHDRRTLHMSVDATIARRVALQAIATR
jgi:hypothetical protein